MMPTSVTLDRFLTPSHRALWEAADDFAAQEIQPRVDRMESAPHRVDRKLARLLAGRRWFGVTVPEAFGGMQAGHVAKTILIHRLARTSAAAAAVLQASLIPVAALLHYGSRDQHKELLPQVADGSTLMSIAVTEPDQGGHIGGMATAAEWDGKAWVLTGEKSHVGNSPIADLHVVVARTAREGTRTSKALTAFLVQGDQRGVTLQRDSSKLGLRGFGFGRIRFDRVRVAPHNVLGDVGQGLDVAQSSSILYGRPNLTAVSLGLHEMAVSLTARYVSTRPRYEGKLADVGVIRDRLGRMSARLIMARILTYHAVDMLDRGLPCDDELIAAKALGHELAAESGNDAMELHAANGLDGDYPIQRIWRDMQTTYAPAGTGEVQRLRLAENLLQEETSESVRTPWSVLHSGRPQPSISDPPIAVQKLPCTAPLPSAPPCTGQVPR
ncbi:acyl-CoA dehydrogenase family protein [Streptomyces sp. V3I7]|uniref:acyl-CoA dehydrogenase family protein n=1 Tax=Streptomyces sp. V3I7 TaxID=3042278 RepID=UPI00278B2ABE|nr:acyl-CoA dehydrogenase family protein [Streptomyces sp. V3I7]MDQ0990728.1 alkylation response protein AidB-like acyl-CoA dehydrogenase [Streptomyces sp. V3I7]